MADGQDVGNYGSGGGQPNPSSPARARIGNYRPVRRHEIEAATGQKPRVRANPDGSFNILGVDGQTWFGPLQPIKPAAQDAALGAVGRQFDYFVGANLDYTPRGHSGLTFQALRDFAENCDILRIVIETRKDQMEALDWTVRPRDKKQKAEVDSVLAVLATPDRINPYSTWMRALLEDRFVIDALTIYPRLTNGGALYSLDLIDGSTIKPLLDATGRQPAPPSPCFQQVLKGVPAVDYTRDELIYRPYNVRTHRIYGYSPVEQIVLTVDTALRRSVSKRDYYTEGSIPDAMGMLPDTWNPAMIAEFQKHWDALFENPTGANATRRKMRWIPGAKSIIQTKDAILKDEFDEWLARIVCYAFSVEPTPFVKQTNRATAETQQEQSRSEGLLPLKKYWKQMMDHIIVTYLKRPELEFAWLDEDATDPLQQAQISAIYVTNGVLSPNEVREDIGRDPRPEPDESRPERPSTEVVVGDSDSTDQPASEAAKAVTGALTKKDGTELDPLSPDRPALADKEAGFAEAIAKELSTVAQSVIKQLCDSKAEKASADGSIEDLPSQEPGSPLRITVTDNIAQLIAGLDLNDFSGLSNVLADTLVDVSVTASSTAMDQTGVVADDLTSLANKRAEAVARQRAAQLIKRNANGGELVESTRDMIRGTVVEAVENGWSNEHLSDALVESYAFSPSRANVIARTELANADSGGAFEGYRASGLVMKKRWQVSNFQKVCDICEENVAAGTIDFEGTFPDGSLRPPSHPNCRCVLVPILGDALKAHRRPN